MKKHIWPILLCSALVGIIVVFLIIAPTPKSRTSAVEKQYDASPKGTTLTYNGKTYYELSDLSRYYDSKMIALPGCIQDFWHYSLFFDERIDLNSIESIPEDRYVQKDTYFIYKNDSEVNPLVIFEKNKGVGGPSDGWYYFSEDFTFEMKDYRTDTVSEIVLATDIDDVVCSISDTEKIDKILTAVNNKEDVVSLLKKETAEDWRFLYVRYFDTPFVQQIGWNISGNFELAENGYAEKYDVVNLKEN